MVLGTSAKVIAVTPIPKLDLGGLGVNPGVTPVDRIPRVDEDECVGCNLCSLVCTVEVCITMERVENGLGPQTWEERSAAGMVREGAEVVGIAEGRIG